MVDLNYKFSKDFINTQLLFKALAAFMVATMASYWACTKATKCDDESNDKKKRECRMWCGLASPVIAAIILKFAWPMLK